MPRVEFYRVNLPVRIENGSEGMIRISIGPSAQHQFETEFQDAARALANVLPEIGPDAFEQDPQPASPNQRADRVVLEICSCELAAEPWEEIFTGTLHGLRHPSPPNPPTSWIPSWVVVRRSRVRPRFLSTPFTLPLRILQLSPQPGHSIENWVRTLFGSRPQFEVDRAVLTASSNAWQAPDSWPTVDILHIDELQALPSIPGTAKDFLTTSRPSIPGTLGWFARWTERWQTRLVILNCLSRGIARKARSLAHALCDKGGPGVLVSEVSAGPWVNYQFIYNLIIHDHPLDQIILQGGSQVNPASLFGGSGREEGVRVSNVGVSLVSMARPSHEEIAPRAYDLWQQRGSPHGSSEEDWFRAEEDLKTQSLYRSPALWRFVEDWDSWKFELHEGEGLLPMSASLENLRAERRGAGQPAPTVPAAPRFVNTSFWAGAATDLKQLSQTEAVLDVGILYQLRIQIGPRDVAIRIVNDEAIFEEEFKWSADQRGVWVEFGVAGIDFDVIGDPVQELWLPRDGPSDPLYFAVRPTTSGIASLRFAFYHQNNLMQSFLLAAITKGQEEPPGTTSDLARTLRIPIDRLQGERYLAKLDYSRITEFSDIEQKSDRALTITANDLDGRSIFVTKGDDVFSAVVYPDDNIRKIVQQLRARLNEISYDKPQTAGGDPVYRFGPYRPDLDERCKAALEKLAAPGRRLYGNLAPSEQQKSAIQDLLSGEAKTIHIASVLRDKVIPWAFVYDCAYDDQKKKDDSGRPLQKGVCTAWLDNSAGSLRALSCGEHPQCLLHSGAQLARQQKGEPLYHEQTVVCPRHFWGFRHVLEVPPRQKDGKAEGVKEPTSIKPTGQVRLVTGMNARLGRYADHWKELGLIQAWQAPLYDRDALLTALKDELLDFIYFYCHARGGQADPGVDPPYLEFQAPGSSSPGIVNPEHLEERAWKHRPLVFLNACGSLGYSPDALSPFLKTLVEGREASGVLGTEVPVAEALAGQVAFEFIRKFLKEGRPAGQALLEVRQTLLAKFNPLGLVYTLFAPAGLVVDLKGGF